ncbi:hypothetical protein HN587_01885 [Candidatus Woesearchaeota archaeon]|jgi:hypothetical protein|nr:hypothetical protein [Candidatus Woesearchaeota archaeon]
MKELIELLHKTNRVDYLLDTCFLVYMFKTNKIKKLVNFCTHNVVGMSEFNLKELLHFHHKLGGTFNHQFRNFLKQELIHVTPSTVSPGERQNEKTFVTNFDPHILQCVPDPSDAVLFVQALQMSANIITRDKHHIFTAVAENYSQKYNIKILNDLPLG